MGRKTEGTWYSRKVSIYVSYGTRICVVLLLCMIWMNVREWGSNNTLLIHFGEWSILETLELTLIIMLILFNQVYEKRRLKYINKQKM